MDPLGVTLENTTITDSPISPEYSTCGGPLSNIQDFVETTIVLKKDKQKDLGISVAGGNDTHIQSICVTEVHKDGAAYKDGRLKEGDVLLVVNEVSLQDVPFSEAVKALREAVSPVKLVVLRENPQNLFTTNEIPTKFVTVELRKTSIKEHLGLSFIQKINGRGVFITYVEPGSKAAGQSRKILQGDQILEINGHNVREYNQKDVAKMLLNIDGAIVFLLGRIPSLTSAIQEWTRAKLRSRTSTWSSYSAAAREKLQNQRPSLPIGHQGTNLGFPSSAICLDRTCSSHENSPNPSLRKSRLSVVTEDAKGLMVTENTEDEEEIECHHLESCNNNGSENPLLPSIRVTSF